MTQANNERKGISVPARFIPTPRTVSPQAQAFLSTLRPGLPALPDVKDKAAWRAYVEAGNHGHVQAYKRMA